MQEKTGKMHQNYSFAIILYVFATNPITNRKLH